MKRSPATLAKFTAAALRKFGYEVKIIKSRQSRSTYLYVETRREDHLGVYSIRFSDHGNPADRRWRQTYDNDRAEQADFEYRTDLGYGFDRDALLAAERRAGELEAEAKRLHIIACEAGWIDGSPEVVAWQVAFQTARLAVKDSISEDWRAAVAAAQIKLGAAA